MQQCLDTQMNFKNSNKPSSVYTQEQKDILKKIIENKPDLQYTPF